MVTLEIVNSFITDNILHSEGWDELADSHKQKALNNALMTLKQFIPEALTAEDPLFDVAEQVMFVIRKDDGMAKAEIGLKGMGVDGISMNYGDITPIAPALITKYGLTASDLSTAKRRRRVGSYIVSKHDTFRTWGDF